MKPFSIFFAACWVALAVASNVYNGFEAIARHARHARSSPQTLIPGEKVKRRSCSAKTSTPSSHASTTTEQAKVQTPSSASVGVIHIESQCGPTGATETVSRLTGPNGHINWLNCGVTEGGWDPPKVTNDNIIIQDIDPDGIFALCEPYLWMFELHAKKYDLHPTMLASTAMQESGCKPQTVGGAGEQGLMQLTKDKCGSAPEGNCKDPYFNIGQGAKLWRELLDQADGNILLACGQYNGWTKGMTVADATAAGDGPCCRCQNNLDYIHQTVNGWYQGVNPYDAGLGLYFNLNKCPM